MTLDIQFKVWGHTADEIIANTDAELARVAPGVDFRGTHNLMIEAEALMAQSGQVITYEATVRARIPTNHNPRSTEQ